MPDILIIGDSFAAPDHANSSYDTWYDSLSKKHRVSNYATPGVGQYKINQQYRDQGDTCILIVTSELRLHCVQNPFYPASDHRHHRSDLIYNDVYARLPDNRAVAIEYFFRDLFDLDHARYIHNLLLRDIHGKIKQHLIPVTFFKPYTEMYDFDGALIDLHEIFQQHRGEINHLSCQGHRLVYEALRDRI